MRSEYASEFKDVRARCIALLATCTASEMGRIDSYGLLSKRSSKLVAVRRKLAVIESVRIGQPIGQQDLVAKYT